MTIYDTALVITAQITLDAERNWALDDNLNGYWAYTYTPNMEANDPVISMANAANPAMDNKTGTQLAMERNYAVIKPVPPVYVSITYDANDGSDEPMEAQEIEAGTTANLTKNTFTRADCSFAGWNTKADGTGTSYADEAEIVATQDVTLYAQWQHDPVKINYYTSVEDGKRFIVGDTVEYGAVRRFGMRPNTIPTIPSRPIGKIHGIRHMRMGRPLRT